jgi:hypothetical protein
MQHLTKKHLGSILVATVDHIAWRILREFLTVLGPFSGVSLTDEEARAFRGCRLTVHPED